MKPTSTRSWSGMLKCGKVLETGASCLSPVYCTESSEKCLGYRARQSTVTTASSDCDLDLSRLRTSLHKAVLACRCRQRGFAFLPFPPLINFSVSTSSTFNAITSKQPNYNQPTCIHFVLSLVLNSARVLLPLVLAPCRHKRRRL